VRCSGGRASDTEKRAERLASSRQCSTHHSPACTIHGGHGSKDGPVATEGNPALAFVLVPGRLSCMVSDRQRNMAITGRCGRDV
jgi:hypothetical protein